MFYLAHVFIECKIVYQRRCRKKPAVAEGVDGCEQDVNADSTDAVRGGHELNDGGQLDYGSEIYRDRRIREQRSNGRGPWRTRPVGDGQRDHESGVRSDGCRGTDVPFAAASMNDDNFADGLLHHNL